MATYWVWRDGPGGYRIYDCEFPTYDGGDPKTLGEPCFSGSGKDIGIFLAKASATAADPTWYWYEIIERRRRFAVRAICLTHQHLAIVCKTRQEAEEFIRSETARRATAANPPAEDRAGVTDDP